MDISKVKKELERIRDNKSEEYQKLCSDTKTSMFEQGLLKGEIKGLNIAINFLEE